MRFSAPIDATTLNPADVVVIRLTLDNATKGPSLPPAPGAQLPRALHYPADYRMYVSGAGPAGALAEAVDGGGTTLVIEPVHPLDASSGATNVGYIVLVTNGIKDTGGHPAVPDTDYATVLQGALADLASGATTPTCASITDPTLNGVCRLTFGHLAIAAQGGLNPANVVLSFSFSTQSTSDTLNILWATYQATPVAAGPIAAAPTGLTTKEFLGAVGVVSPGYADVWVGIVTVPYYLTAAANTHDAAPVTAHCTAAGPSPAPGIDPTSRKLTRFNPVPLKTSNQTIPVIIGVPDVMRTGCAEPMLGWPVVVFQHGFLGNRSQALATFDAYTSHCFVVVTIDLPVHGITDPTNPLFHNQLFANTPAAALITGERTFDLDIESNTTGAPGPDGVIDPSGTTFFAALGHLLTVRDDLRQAQSDLLWLAHALPTLSFGVNANGTSDVDGNRLQYSSLSLGSIVGLPIFSVVSLQTGMPNSPYKSGTLSVPGGAFAYIARDSIAFSPTINALLSAGSGGLLVPGVSNYDNWIRDAQTIFDAGDPLNYAAAAVAARPILIQQVVGGGLLPNATAALPDQVVPNSATQRLITAANFARFTPGQTPLAAGHGAYVNFIYGMHGSILSPAGTANTGPTNGASTLEMQTEAVTFALAGGQVVTVGAGSPAVIQP